MNRSFELFNFRAKAVLCMTLVVAMHVVVGCGNGSLLLPNGGSTRVELTPDHPLAAALAGSPYSSAVAVEVNPVTNQFRVIFPDGSQQQLSGTMSTENGTPQVKQLTMAQGSKSVTISFNASQEISNIVTSAGPSWQRSVTNRAPSAAQAPRAPSARVNSLESYLAANADIVQVAQQMDSQGPTQTASGLDQLDQSGSSGQVVKTDAAFWPLFAVLAVFAFPGLILATIYFVIQVVVVINAIF